MNQPNKQIKTSAAVWLTGSSHVWKFCRRKCTSNLLGFITNFPISNRTRISKQLRAHTHTQIFISFWVLFSFWIVVIVVVFISAWNFTFPLCLTCSESFSNCHGVDHEIWRWKLSWIAEKQRIDTRKLCVCVCIYLYEL